jgi:putative ABC transport system permease protein
MRQLLIESLALGLIATAGGILLAAIAIQGLLPLVGDSIPVPRITQAGIDGRVLAFSALVALLTSVVFSLAPAFDVIRADPAGALKEGAANIARGRHRFRSALVVGQITLGLVLLVGAELLIASFRHLSQQDPGFRTDRLLTFDVGLPEGQYGAAGQIAFYDRLIERLRAIPGVRAVATGRPLPLQGHEMRAAFDIEERRAAVPDRPRSDIAIVTPGYFGAMGIPLLKGRDFSERDAAGALLVLVVNEAFARKYFSGEEVIGKRIQSGAGPTVMREIVGVVGDAKQAALGVDPDPIYYFPYKQLPWGLGTIVLRTAVRPAELESTVRAELAGLDRQAAVHQFQTGEDLSARATAGIQFPMVLMGSFAAIALLLTVTGLYGVLSYTVARRRREIGVRIALGAGRREVLGLVLRDAGLLVMAGLILGSAGALGAGRLLGSTVYGVRPGDPLILACACCIMVITSLAAAYVPALRAASVDPMQALRSE